MLSVGRNIKQQWKLSLLVVLFLPLLLRLGFWQLERAEQKRQLASVYQYQQSLPAIPFISDDKHSKDINYRPLILTGTYDNNRYWLIDNIPRNGEVGYEVVMPFNVKGQWVLVNRGWVAAPLLRDQLPVIPALENSRTITGYFYSPSKNAVINSGASDWVEPWPQRVLHLDLDVIEQSLEGSLPVYSKVFRINEESPSAFITDWPVMNTLPEKHHGYAVQWFAMSLALLLLYLWALFKKYD